MLGGDQTQIGADSAAGEAGPVTDLHRQAEGGEHRDSAQAHQRTHDRGVAFGRSEGRDLRIQPVPAVQRQFRGLQTGLVGGLQGRIIKVLPVQPGVVGIPPGLSAGVDQAVAQQELRDPVPGPHQVRPDVLAGTDQIPGGLIREARNPYRGYLPQQGQPGQMFGVAGISLHPVPGRTLELGRCRNQALDPCTGQ